MNIFATSALSLKTMAYVQLFLIPPGLDRRRSRDFVFFVVSFSLPTSRSGNTERSRKKGSLSLFNKLLELVESTLVRPGTISNLLDYNCAIVAPASRTNFIQLRRFSLAEAITSRCLRGRAASLFAPTYRFTEGDASRRDGPFCFVPWMDAPEGEPDEEVRGEEDQQ